MSKAVRTPRFYAVAIGRKPGIYRTWDECNAQVQDFPRSSFKGFNQENAARRFIDSGGRGLKMDLMQPSQVDSVTGLNTLFVYTDASHIKGTARRGYSAWARHNNIEYELVSRCDDRAPEISNPTLELEAAARVLEVLLDRALPTVECICVRADYIGVIRYGEGEWRGERASIEHFRIAAVRLQAAVQRYKSDRPAMRIDFQHVRGHTGIEGNERADALAISERECNTFADLAPLVVENK